MYGYSLEYNDNKRHNILIADDSKVILNLVTKILNQQNYNILTALNGEEALELIKREHIDIILTDINMPKLNGFSLIEELISLELKIPYVMMTDSEINRYLELAIKNDVGNILSKPINKDELLTTVYRLLYPDTLFGLHNYLKLSASDIKTVKIKGSNECSKLLPMVLKEAEEKTNLSKDSLASLYLVLNELAINAIYHPHGFTKEKEERKVVVLDDAEIEISYASDENKFGISVTDFAGKLRKVKILSSFRDLFVSNEKMQKALDKGEDPLPYIKDKGRGLQIARELSTEYYFNIQKDKKTQLIILTNKEEKEESRGNSSSIKINEIY